MEEELEFTTEQEERIDDIYNAAFEFAKVMTEKPDLDWDMAFIGEIADSVASIMVDHNYPVRFPAIVTEDDGSEHIEEFYN